MHAILNVKSMISLSMTNYQSKIKLRPELDLAVRSKKLLN